MTASAQFSELPQADAALLRSHREQILSIADRHQIRDLRLAVTGELVGRGPEEMDSVDVVEFELDVTETVGRRVYLVSEKVLSNPRASKELRDARAL